MESPIVSRIDGISLAGHPSAAAVMSEVRVIRKPWLDYLRLMAMGAVIAGHTSVDFIFMYGQIGQFEWWIANLLTSICRYPVALFVMVSGAILLGRQYSPREFYKKRAARLIPALIFWNFFYLLFYIALGMDRGTVLWTLKAQMFADGYIAVHLWFLTMFVCLMMFVPFINKFINGEKPTGADLALLLGMTSLFYLVNGVSSIGDGLFDMKITWHTAFVWYIPYLIGGYYLSVHADHIRVRRRVLVLLIVVLYLVAAFANYYLTRTRGVVADYLAFGDAGPFGYVITPLIFLLARKSTDILVANPIVTRLSEAAFGVYLIHEVFASLLVRSLPDFYSNPILYVPIVIVLTALLSVAAALLLRKIPFAKAIC